MGRYQLHRYCYRILTGIVLCTVLVLPIAAAENGQIPAAATSLERYIHILSLEAGRLPPPADDPIHSDEFSYFLSLIPESRLSAAGKRLYEALEASLDREPWWSAGNLAAVDGSLIYALELYAHTNSSDFTAEQDWIRRWADRSPIISIPVAISFGNISGYTEYIIRQRLLDSYSNPVGIYSQSLMTNNSITDFFQLDLNWPYRAYVTAGGDNWNVQFGRDRVNWGYGHTGNLMLSGHQPFHDILLFSAWSDIVAYTTGIVRFTPPDWGDGSGPGQTENELDDYKALIAHRLSLRPTDTLQVTVTEAMMYQSDNLDLAYLNPAMIYHQYFMRPISNSLLTIELEWVPVPSLMLYGQFGVDEMQILGESTATIPNALGIITGCEYAVPLRESYLMFWGEFVHIDPYFYLRDGVNFITPIRSQYPEGGFTMVDSYTGYPWGGDVEAFAFGTTWDLPGGAELSASYTNMARGEVTASSPYPPADPQATAPSGIPEYRSTLSFRGSMEFPLTLTKKSALTVDAEVCWYSITNMGNILSDAVHDLQLITTCKIQI